MGRGLLHEPEYSIRERIGDEKVARFFRRLKPAATNAEFSDVW
jgi:hypothetical protein